MVKAIMLEQGLPHNQAFTKVYDEVYMDEVERIKELGVKKWQTEVQFFFKTKQILSQHELETWTDEKIELYKAMTCDDVYENVVSQLTKR